MNNLEKSAGQNLEDFKKIMKELKPYLPPKMIIKEPKPQPYKINDIEVPYHPPIRNTSPNL